jgi:hypothetical protein
VAEAGTIRWSERPELALSMLEEWFESEAPPLEQLHVDRDLLRARIADRYRDLELEPIDPATFEELSRDLVPEAWRRLDLAVSALDLEGVREVMPRLLGGDPRAQLELGFIELARSSDLLTMESLRSSPQRVQEFARRWILRLGGRVAGETEAESAQRLEEIDYRRVPSRQRPRPSDAGKAAPAAGGKR